MYLESAGPSDGLITMNAARLMPTFSTHISPHVSSHDISPSIASTHHTSDEIPTGASDAIAQETSLVIPPHINLANVILPAGLREQSLCADLRQKVVDARKTACGECVRHDRPCVQTNAASWKCQQCLRRARSGCDWHTRTVASLGAECQRPPIDMTLRRKLESDGMVVDRARSATTPSRKRTCGASAPKSRKRSRVAYAVSEGDTGEDEEDELDSSPDPSGSVEHGPVQSKPPPTGTSRQPHPSSSTIKVLERIAERVDRIYDLLKDIADDGTRERGEGKGKAVARRD